MSDERNRDDGTEELATAPRRAVLASIGGAATFGTVGCLGLGSGSGSGGGGCDTPSTDNLQNLLPEIGEGFSVADTVTSGISAGTDDWVAQVIRGSNGSSYAFLVGKYDSRSAAEEGVNQLTKGATTTPAYVLTGRYLFFVDGAGSKKSIKKLLAAAPTLSSECVDKQVTFPYSETPTNTPSNKPAAEVTSGEILYEESFEFGASSSPLVQQGLTRISSDTATDGSYSLEFAREMVSSATPTVETDRAFTGPISVTFDVRMSTKNRYAGVHFGYGDYRFKHSFQAQKIALNSMSSSAKPAQTSCTFKSDRWYSIEIRLTSSETVEIVDGGRCRYRYDESIVGEHPLRFRAYVPNNDDTVHIDNITVSQL